MKKRAFNFSARSVLAIFMILFLVGFVAGGCSGGGSGSKDKTSENGTGDNGGNGGAGDNGDTGGNGGTGDNGDTGDNGGTGDGDGDDPMCKVVLLDDDFSGSLATNWTTGTNTAVHAGGPTVAIDNQEVLFPQNFDYIETKKAFTGNFQVQAYLKRNAGVGSTQCASYYVELVGLDGVSAIMRFRYGADAKESINIGKPPVSGQTRAHDCIREDPRYLEELDHVGDLKGLLTLTYNNGNVEVSWTNSEGATINTLAMSTGTFTSSKIRIWALAGHRIEYVRVCGLDDDAGGDNGDDDNGDGNGGGEGVMPLSIGNWWLYSLESGGAVPGTYRMDAVRTQKVSGVTATRIEYSGDPMYEGHWSLLVNQGDALYLYGDSFNGVLSTPDLWFKSSLKKGDTWQTSGQGGVVDWVVISTSEKVTVPAGKFDCILVRGVGEAGTHADHWWAVGIGEVKYEMDIDVAVIRGELTDYSVE